MYFPPPPTQIKSLIEKKADNPYPFPTGPLPVTKAMSTKSILVDGQTGLSPNSPLVLSSEKLLELKKKIERKEKPTKITHLIHFFWDRYY